MNWELMNAALAKGIELIARDDGWCQDARSKPRHRADTRFSRDRYVEVQYDILGAVFVPFQLKGADKVDICTLIWKAVFPNRKPNKKILDLEFPISKWNDTEGRTALQVIEALQRAKGFLHHD
jgi:hypothetical protein